MKQHHIIKNVCTIVLCLFAYTIVQAKPWGNKEEQLSPTVADLYLTDGTVKHVEHLTSVPCGYCEKKDKSKKSIRYNELDSNGQIVEYDIPSTEVESIICWHALTPENRFKLDKIRNNNSDKKHWAILVMEGKKCKVYRIPDICSVTDKGEMSMFFIDGKGYSCFLFEGDERATTCQRTPSSWIYYPKNLFENDEQMIKDVKNGKYKKEDLQMILDTYQRPTPLTVDR